MAEIDSFSENIFQQVWQNNQLKKALISFYHYEQGFGRCPPSLELEMLLSSGLAVRAAGRIVLSSIGTSLAYNLLAYEEQVEKRKIDQALLRLEINQSSRVVDIGCGGGQTLFAIQRFSPQEVFGIDRDRYGIAFANFLFSRQGIPKQAFAFLDVPSDNHILPCKKFTHLICRGVLHKLKINRNLGNFSRWLMPGGRLYLFVPTLSYYLFRLKMVLHNPGRLGYFLFVFFNGLLFAATGLQLTLKLGRRRLSEIFFTEGSLKRALRRNGFKIEIFQRQPPKGRCHFLEVFGVKVLTDSGRKE